MRPRWFVLVPVGFVATSSCYSSGASPGESGANADDAATGRDADVAFDVEGDTTEADAVAVPDEVSLDDVPGPDDSATPDDGWVELEDADTTDVPAEEVDAAVDGAADGGDAGWRGCDAGDCRCVFPYPPGGFGDCGTVLGWEPMAEGVCTPITGCSCGDLCDGIPFLEGRQYWTCDPSYHDAGAGPWEARQACECCPTPIEPAGR